MELAYDNYCFACGKDNPIGLKLSDFRFEGEDLVVDFTPAAEHQGWRQITHGGIVATLLDEIMTWRVINTEGDTVTAELCLRLCNPLPVLTPVQVRGRVVSRKHRMIQTEGEITGEDGIIYATATAKFMLTNTPLRTAEAKLR